MAAPQWNVMQSLYAPIPGAAEQSAGRQSRYPSQSSGRTSSSTKDKTDDVEMFETAKYQYLQGKSSVKMQRNSIRSQMFQYLMDSDDPVRASENPDFKEMVNSYYQLETVENQIEAKRSLSESIFSNTMEQLKDEEYGSKMYMDQYGNAVGYGQDGKVTTDQSKIKYPMMNMEMIDIFKRTNLGENIAYGADYTPGAWRDKLMEYLEQANTTESFSSEMSAGLRQFLGNTKNFIATGTTNAQQISTITNAFRNLMSPEEERSAKADFYMAMRNTFKPVYTSDENGEQTNVKWTTADYKNRAIDPATGEPIQESKIGTNRYERWGVNDYNEWLSNNFASLNDANLSVEIDYNGYATGEDGDGTTEGYQDKTNYQYGVYSGEIFVSPMSTIRYHNATGMNGIPPNPIRYHTIINSFTKAKEFNDIEGIANYTDNQKTMNLLKYWHDWWKNTGSKMANTSFPASGVTYESPLKYFQEMVASALDGHYKEESYKRYPKEDNTGQQGFTHAFDKQEQYMMSTYSLPLRYVKFHDTDEAFEKSGFDGVNIAGAEVILPGYGIEDPQVLKGVDGYVVGIESIMSGPNKYLQSGLENMQVYTNVIAIMHEDALENIKFKMKKGGITPEMSNYYEERKNPDLGIIPLDKSENLQVEKYLKRIPGTYVNKESNEPFKDITDNRGNYFLVPLVLAGKDYWYQASRTFDPEKRTPQETINP